MFQVIVADGLQHVFSLAMMGDYLYWSDWRRDELLRVNKWTGVGIEVVRGFSFTRLMGVLAFYNDTCKLILISTTIFLFSLY